MPFEVVLAEHAEADLRQVYGYVAEHDSRTAADQVLDRLVIATESLADAPERGSIPTELRGLGLTEYRQVFFQPCRIIYRVHARQVAIYLIVGGRRDMASVLAKRLLGS
jgi:toxin ParE1/3/4